MSGAARFVRYYLDREPIVVLSFAIGAVALALPVVVVPVRRSLGYPTYQYDGPNVDDYVQKQREKNAHRKSYQS